LKRLFLLLPLALLLLAGCEKTSTATNTTQLAPTPTPEPPPPVEQPVQQAPIQQLVQPPAYSGGDKDCKDFATHAEAQKRL
jgi:hypothetical protein